MASQPHPSAARVATGAAYPIVVFSHLAWTWVWQRPQHLISRIARAHPVLFVQEPAIVEDAGPPRFHVEPPRDNVTVAWPEASIARADGEGGYNALAGRLAREWMAAHGVTDPVYWLYTPMAVTALPDGFAGVVVYDAMDELAAFRYAPPVIKEREAALMARADLVFTGGPSLYKARAGRHPSVHCFPSGVERAHFAQALAPGTVVPEALAALPRPRIGYYGVIDERTDLPLLAEVAALRPAYQWVMVGPVAKIEEAALPQAPNLHYPGRQDYDVLPGFLKGFDVCIMPFARNESTRFISPTKTLEYLAAHKPIVSTPIPDVAESYGEIVRLAETPEAFAAAVDAALAEPEAARAARVAAEDAVLAGQEWDRIAAAMLRLIDAARAARTGAG